MNAGAKHLARPLSRASQDRAQSDDHGADLKVESASRSRSFAGA